jgi:hypothetical protein
MEDKRKIYKGNCGYTNKDLKLKDSKINPSKQAKETYRNTDEEENCNQ